MRRRLIFAMLLALLGVLTGSSQIASDPVFLIRRPTVIAFFSAVTEAELQKDADLNEVLSDFQLYASQAGPRLRKAGIDFEVANADRFTIRDGKSVHTFKTGKVGVGYYFVSPAKKPRVEYGVHDDSAILETASKYFKIPVAGN